MFGIGKRLTAVTLLLALSLGAAAQSDTLRFAFLTDLHYSKGSRSVENLERCIGDINARTDLQFVLFGGDLTDFGTDEELAEVKGMLDKLKLPYWVVAGNHDSTWSESGCNTFIKVFGYERFCFEAGGWRFIGCNCGPDMRMSPALLPKECLVWLDGLEKGKKTIFINHYPMDSSVLNYFEVIDRLKKLDVKFTIGGHVHKFVEIDSEGIPGVLCKTIVARKVEPVYSIISIAGDRVRMMERTVCSDGSCIDENVYGKDISRTAALRQRDAEGMPLYYEGMKYDVNAQYPQIHERWSISDDSNVVAGFALSKGKAFYPTTTGYVRAISLKDGSRLWTAKFGGKIFSTPASDGKMVVFGCTDNYIYCISEADGSLIWKVHTGKSVVGSPVIRKGVAYIGGSDGCFRAIRMKDGKELWRHEGLAGFVVGTPFVDDVQVVTGCWGRKMYSLRTKTGELMWEWESGSASRMKSPAACVPVKAAGRIFFANPDRYLYVLDAGTGKQLFRVDGGREAICLSSDGRTVFVKGMFNFTYALDTDVPSGAAVDGELGKENLRWYCDDNRMGYEISPSALSEIGGTLLLPADKGNIIAQDAETGSFLWAHKISAALVNPMKVWKEKGKKIALASAMDGKICLLDFE